MSGWPDKLEAFLNGGDYKKTPTVIQMEAVECGAAALAIILGFHGKIVPLEELRVVCGVSRDGSKASSMVKAARGYGLAARGVRKEPEELRALPMPMIVHWNFNHFLVVEGFGTERVFLNDPASGRRTVSTAEFDEAFTGIALLFEPGPDFVRSSSRPSMIGSLRQRLTGHRTTVAFLVLVGLCLVVPGLVVPAFTRIFIDDVLVAGNRDWLKALLFGMLVTMAVEMVLTWCREHYLLRFETKLAVSTSGKFFWHVLRLPMEFFTNRYGGDIVSRVQINDTVAQMLAGQVATAFLDCLMIGFFLAVLLYYDVALTLVGMVIAALNVAFLLGVARWRRDQNMKFLQDQGKLAGVTMGGLQIIETVKAGGNEADLFDKWTGYQIKLMNAEQRLSVYNEMLGAVPVSLMALNTSAILVLGGYKVIAGQMTIGALMAYQGLMASFLGPVNRLVGFGGVLQEMDGDLRRLDDVMKYEIDPQTADNGAELTATKLAGLTEFADVTFGYNRLEPPLLAGFSLTAPPGARIALVGGSGSGKSTVARLAAGLYRPWSGEIRFDGRRREMLPRELITNSLTSVDQDICLFEGTVRENLTMWDTTISDADLFAAARDAAIHDDIIALPDAYDYRMAEGGRDFSGGQRQRLEIARALATNPAVLILDEATSALDPVTEKTVMENIRRRGCTCLIVAHRLSAVRDADEIIVLEYGQIVQRGRHEDLIAADGLYHDLVGSTAGESGESAERGD
jgi:NHLM bacteriocin system ABC transporter peptidase/ATP-binding protein